MVEYTSGNQFDIPPLPDVDSHQAASDWLYSILSGDAKGSISHQDVEMPELVLVAYCNDVSPSTLQVISEIALRALAEMVDDTSSRWIAPPGEALLRLVDPLFLASPYKMRASDLLYSLIQRYNDGERRQHMVVVLSLQALLTLDYRQPPDFWLDNFRMSRDSQDLVQVVFEGISRYSPRQAMYWLSNQPSSERVVDAIYNILQPVLLEIGDTQSAQLLSATYAMQRQEVRRHLDTIAADLHINISPNIGRDAIGYWCAAVADHLTTLPRPSHLDIRVLIDTSDDPDTAETLYLQAVRDKVGSWRPGQSSSDSTVDLINLVSVSSRAEAVRILTTIFAEIIKHLGEAGTSTTWIHPARLSLIYLERITAAADTIRSLPLMPRTRFEQALGHAIHSDELIETALRQLFALERLDALGVPIFRLIAAGRDVQSLDAILASSLKLNHRTIFEVMAKAMQYAAIVFDEPEQEDSSDVTRVARQIYEHYPMAFETASTGLNRSIIQLPRYIVIPHSQRHSKPSDLSRLLLSRLMRLQALIVPLPDRTRP